MHSSSPASSPTGASSRSAAVHAASFGLSVVVANWVVTLLVHAGHDERAAALFGALTLLGGIVTCPLGGLAIRRRPARARPLLAASVAAGAVGTLALAAPLPLALAGAAALVVGLAAGVPFAGVFTGAQAVRPDAPAAAVGLVNAYAVLAIVVGTPLVGLTFALPGEGLAGFVALALLWASALLAVPRLPR